MSSFGLARPGIRMQWGIRIPLRDGTRLNASLYLPDEQEKPRPCLFALTPYTVQRNHLRASYFATEGYPFLVVDSRGRGNSEGVFRPFIQESDDGYDIVEWIANQPFCDGKVAMFSGSYEGYVQWVIAKERPPHLVTIVPGMAAVPGLDWPMVNNIFLSYTMQWLTYVSGHTAQENIFTDQALWRAKFREWFESGRPFKELDSIVGNPSPIFQEWLLHPAQGSYWDAFEPKADQFARIKLPILTLTGSYDVNQPGALHHYKEHLRHSPTAYAAQHYLVIGPWNHSSVLAPKSEFAGLKFGPAALLDVMKLCLDWYNWILRSGPKPQLLQRNVTYYVMGSDRWRYADSLEAVTARSVPYYLRSTVNATDAFRSGQLTIEPPSESDPDHYIYDPRDVSLAALESTVDPEDRVDQRMVHAAIGKQVVYHSPPFQQDAEISGFFRLVAWLSIDQPDTDFRVSVYEIGIDGGAIQLSSDCMRARYRESLRKEKLISTSDPLRYDFESFTFVSRQVRRGHRFRLVIGPVNSIHCQKNYNGGGVVAEESIRDARRVTVRLFHDPEHPSALYVPFGQLEDDIGSAS